MNIKAIEKEFNKYSNSFDLSNDKIKYKYYHSYRVEELSKQLIKQLSNKSEKIDLATTIGLLHDIGRYRQCELCDSFNDDIIDHADLGVKILFDEGLIKKFEINKKYYDVIYFAIKNHNKYAIEPCPYEDSIFQAKLIRDTDKIDILDAYLGNKFPKISTMKNTSPYVSDDTKNEFYQNRPINKLNRHTQSDVEVLRIALLFDINFDESLSIIETKKILKRYYELLKDNDTLIPYLDYVSNYLEKRSKKHVRKKI